MIFSQDVELSLVEHCSRCCKMLENTVQSLVTAPQWPTPVNEDCALALILRWKKFSEKVFIFYSICF